MATTIRLDVVSAEEALFSGDVLELTAPGEMGAMGILPNHSQLIATLKPGELNYKTSEGVSTLFVAGGIIEVQPTIVTILADSAVRAEDLDEKAAEAAVGRAQDALAGKDPEDLDYAAIQAELDAAKAQIEMIHRIGKTLKH
ncbi:F0F1 ATP synthase subunit epsilon [Leucothrix pacifica]|uniref:ATP synthase epsilon chain n=1 Tax=Leucothrix pacifica TaxID=1247513 RepID=A0A317CRG0_9GAMM|nr:F0F1 ATP synthase subunit epsilon [Leucothrix pacifica]PWR00124.1 F0F1 ATP synthase subunit epsilon [Leucothrix pacifica]